MQGAPAISPCGKGGVTYGERTPVGADVLRDALDGRNGSTRWRPNGRGHGGGGWLASPSARPKTASALENDRGRRWETHWPRRKGCQFR